MPMGDQKQCQVGAALFGSALIQFGNNKVDPQLSNFRHIDIHSRMLSFSNGQTHVVFD
jgi:hypothetical protein